MEANITAEHKISRRIGNSLFQLCIGIWDINVNQSRIFRWINVKCETILCELDFQVLACTAFRLVELKARCVQAQTAMSDRSVLVDDELVVFVGGIPCRRHGGREQCRPIGKGKFRAVFALIVAADEGNRIAVLLFQGVQCRIVGHIFHRHTVPVGKGGQPLGLNGDFYLVRFCRNILSTFLQFAEAPEEVHIPTWFITVEMVSDVALTLHIGVGRTTVRHCAESFRKNNINALHIRGLRQSYKGICPRVAVHINIADIDPAIVASLKEGVPGRQIFHLAGKNRAFGRFRMLIRIVDSASHLNCRTVCGVCVTHAGKVVEGITPPWHISITISHRRDISACDIDTADGRQYAPGIF